MAGPLNIVHPVRRDFTGLTVARYTRPLALSGWFYVRNLAGTGGNGYVLNLKASANTYGIGMGFYFSTPAAGYAAFQCILGGSSTNLSRWSTSGNTFPVGRWVHGVFVIKSGFDTDGAQATAWMNGTEKAGALIASAGSAAALSGGAEMFDRAYDSARQFNGQAEDLALWALNPSSAQVAEIMGLRTEAQWAASSLAAASLVARVTPAGAWQEYSGGVAENLAEPVDTGAGAVTVVDFGAIRTALPWLRAVATRLLPASAAYTDLGSTPAAATGDLLRQLTDLSGLGNNATAPADTTRPEFTAETGRAKACAWENVTYNRRMAVAAASVFPADCTTLVVAGRVRGLTRSYRAVLGNTNIEAGFATTGQMRVSGVNFAVDGCDSPSTFAWICGPSSTKVWRDAQSATGAAVGTGAASGGYLGATAAGGSPFDGEMYEVLVLHEVLTDARYLELHTYLAGAHGYTDKSDTVIVVGTSSGRGQAAGAAFDLAWFAYPSLSGVRFINLSVGGEVVTTTDDYAADVQAIVQREQALGNRTPAVLVWQGINDIYVADVAPATVAANLGALLTVYAGYGVSRFAVCTLAPRSETAQNADRLTFNATVESGGLSVTGAGYRVVGIAALPRVAAGGNVLAAEFDSGDGNHGNKAYFQYVASDAFVPAVAAMTKRNRGRLLAALEQAR